MSITNYARGVRRERQAVAELRAAGYLTFRSAGSRGPFDLVAIPARRLVHARTRPILLLQVKSGRGPSPVERGVLGWIGRVLRGRRFRVECWTYHRRMAHPRIQRF